MELPLVHLVLGLGRKGKALFESAADVQTIGSGGVRWPEVRLRYETRHSTEKIREGFFLHPCGWLQGDRG
jgi:hypothetical protein